MTNWEKSCVDALVSSPTAFALFKAKQKNKKHIDQYINTIWPYEIKKKFDNNYSSHENEIIVSLKKSLSYIINNVSENDRYETVITFKTRITRADAVLVFMNNMEQKTFSCRGNNILEICFISEVDDHEAFNVEASKESAYIDRIIQKLGLLSGNYVTRIKIRMISGRTNQNEIILAFLNLFRNKEKKNKFKRVYLGQNIGIEIEYEGIWQKYLEKKLNSSRYAVSFNSGIDGGETNGAKYNDGSRLRENRLRINGHRGLSALHYLVEDMIKSKCSITNKSGMHYHIDLTHLTEKKRDIPARERFRKICASTEIERQLADIFELGGNRIIIETLYTLLRYPTEFTTIEWRMGTPTFNFTKLTIQILCAIHVTNVLFGSKKTMDVEYLTYLAEIYKQINS